MDLIQAAYAEIYYSLGGNPMLIALFGWVFILILWYWTLSGLFLYSDLTGRPQWMTKYKVQPGQNQPVDKAKLLRAVKTVAYNTIFLNLINFYPLHLFNVWVGMRFGLQDTPSVWEILKDFIAFALVQEVIFYYSHRLFHHKYIYAAVHKKHHEWTAPIGLIATYAGPLEYMTGNGMSVFLGPVLMKSHIVTVWLWYFMATTVTIIHHSGYHLPLLPSPQFHDFHHLKFRSNYGTLGILDWLHGTDEMFQDRIEQTRHRILWSTDPAWKVFPEDRPVGSQKKGTPGRKVMTGYSDSHENRNGVKKEM